MTVDELVEALDAYGGHLPVCILQEGAARAVAQDMAYGVFVEDRSVDGEHTVLLAPDPEVAPTVVN